MTQNLHFQCRPVQRDDGVVLHGRDRLLPRLLALTVHRVPGSEAGKPASRPRRSPQNHRLRLRQEGHGPHVDPLRHPRVPGSRNNSEQRSQQGCRLVGPWHSRLRNARRISALL